MSAMKTKKTNKNLASAIGTYIVLVIAAAVILFPFIITLTTSVKGSKDVFNYPPRVLPYFPVTRDVADVEEPAALFRVNTPTGVREYVKIQDGVSASIYRDPKNPEDRVLALSDDAKDTGRKVMVDGKEQSLYTVTSGGKTMERFLDPSFAIAGLFANPDNLKETILALNADTKPVEKLGARFENFKEVSALQNLDRALTNTILVTVLVVSGQLVTSILGGYAFSRVKFKGRNAVFLMYLGSIMIPFVVLMVPLFQEVVAVGWNNRMVALIIPFLFSAYGTFLMRQFFSTLPVELEEAAFIDGASRGRIVWRILVPLAKPALATLASFSFLYAWNSFVWPLIASDSGNLDGNVLSIALSTLGGRAADKQNLVLAGVLIATIPPVAVFIAAQRHFVESVASSSVKG
jgi:ABC-type glycerol-3-phosphate transport system permease component